MLRHVSQRGGMGNYTRQLMAAMLGSDRANEYVMYYSPTERLGRYVGANVIEHVVRARSKLLWDQWAIPRQAARDRVDLIFNPKLSVPLRSPVPGVFVLHGPEHFVVPSAYDPVDRLQAHILMPRYVRSAAAVILSTEDAKAMTCKLIADAPEKIHVIRQAVDARFTKAVTNNQITATRAKYGLPDRFMLFVGGLHRIKNFGRIAEALAALRSRLGDATPPLVAAGFVTASYPSEAGAAGAWIGSWRRSTSLACGIWSISPATSRTMICRPYTAWPSCSCFHRFTRASAFRYSRRRRAAARS